MRTRLDPRLDGLNCHTSDRVDVWVGLHNPILPFGFILTLIDTTRRAWSWIVQLLQDIHALNNGAKRGKTLRIQEAVVHIVYKELRRARVGASCGIDNRACSVALRPC